MPKTFEDYLNDSRIKNEPMGLRMTHAMRFKMQDEQESMSTPEYDDISNKRIKQYFAEFGIIPKYTSPFHTIEPVNPEEMNG